MNLDPQADPGWRASLRQMGKNMIPGMALRAQSATDGLVALRGVFLVFVVTPLLMLLVLTFIAPIGDGPMSPWFAWVTVYGVVAVAIVAVRRRRPLKGTTESELAMSYRSEMFVQVAFSESALLWSFVAVFLTSDVRVYFVGMIACYAGLAMAAPSASNLRARQAQLGPAGFQLSLVRALKEPLAPGSASDGVE